MCCSTCAVWNIAVEQVTSNLSNCWGKIRLIICVCGRRRNFAYKVGSVAGHAIKYSPSDSDLLRSISNRRFRHKYNT